MRNRSSLIPFIFIVLVIIILAQNGVLGSVLASLSSSLSTGITFGPTPLPTGRPLVFLTAPSNQGLAPSDLPTGYAPLNPTQAQPIQPILSGRTQTLVPSGAVGVEGQCVVPTGWVAYTVQAGETLAVIAQRYNLTAEQMTAANCLQTPDMIYEEQVLAVPGAR